MPVLPSVEEFPYAIRQVSGRSAPTARPRWARCAPSTLSLLNAGVPLKARWPVSPWAGLRRRRRETSRYVALTDILGAEDAFGDMDFKVAGTKGVRHRAPAGHQARRHPVQVLAGALSPRPRTPGWPSWT